MDQNFETMTTTLDVQYFSHGPLCEKEIFYRHFRMSHAVFDKVPSFVAGHEDYFK